MEASLAAEILLTRVRARTRASVSTRASVRDARVALAAELERLSAVDGRRRRHWAAYADGLDVPGAVYESLVNAAERRRLGQFQTPFYAADVMAGWVLTEPADCLFDPGVGSARLLFRAWQRAEPSPRRFVGWDKDQLCLLMAELNMRARRVANYRLTRADFFSEQALVDDGLAAHPPDAVTANPPFCRHDLLPRDEKEAIHRGLEHRLGLRLSRRAGLHALFLLRALEVAAQGARLAFLTPNGWLDAEYGEAVKAHILRTAHLEAMVIFGTRSFFFDGVRTTAALTFLRKEPRAGSPTLVVRVGAGRPEIADLLAAVRGHPTPLRVENVHLRTGRHWARPPVRLPRGTPLSDLARVRRGVATGCNGFFVLSEGRRRDIGIATSDLRPCLNRPRHIPGDELTAADLDALADDIPRWLLDPPFGAEEGNTALARYLRWGREVLKVHERHLSRHRNPWFVPEQRDNCAIVMPCMHRNEARFIRNRAAAVPLNSFHVIEPLDGVHADALFRALSKPSVLRQLRRLGRDYGNGLWKVEPGALRRVRVSL